MEFSIPGFIKEFCTPNALLTLEEYLVDYATPETRKVGEKLIKEELAKMGDGDMKDNVVKRLQEIKENKNRDLYF
jgi:2-iminoacetate synthase